MTGVRPRLITFAASHFCEKARWALDWHGIAYDEVGWPPGLHVVLARSCGAKHTTLPILLDGSEVIQGSGAIIDWAESKAQNPSRSLNPEAALTEAMQIERRADEVIGPHVRRLAFCRVAAWPLTYGQTGAVLSGVGLAPRGRQHDVTDGMARAHAHVRREAIRRSGKPSEA